MKNLFYIGLDVGSTSIKSVVMDDSFNIIWKKYERHETKQAEKILSFLEYIEDEFQKDENELKFYVTGSGASHLAQIIGAKYVQEVNAISFAVEKLLPDTGSVIELGGQDAKIILFLKDELTGKIKKIASMNDKCAGGTGAVIDKISSKLKISPNDLQNQPYNGIRIHQVAGKCGVFAETDINSLQKQGIKSDELIASLFESIVLQNLSVLTRGYTLRPKVVLLGGPNTFVKGLVECWQANIIKLWKERKFNLPEFSHVNEIIYVPENSEFYGAIGSILFGVNFDDTKIKYNKLEKLIDYISAERDSIRKKTLNKSSIPPLYENVGDFLEKYQPEQFVQKKFTKGETAELFVGIDGGSTSSKAVLINKNKEIVTKYYQISRGNPIDDVKEIFKNLREQVECDGAKLSILGVGVTGYAKNIIKDAISADIAIVETVAHTKAAQHFYNEVDVVCDVGGQDIKIITVRHGRVVDFKLNTQCSAGNGYFLQNTAESFGFKMQEYAEKAFSVKNYPEFGYGCAVFLQSDIVNFQRQGWTSEEILAGLACVLPKNIWLYVSQIPNLTLLGKNFVLQGGTQYNLAAAKAQIDFIESKFKEKNLEPNIIIHKHAGECGAFGAGLEAIRNYEAGNKTRFIGLEKVQLIQYKTIRDERTKCSFCKNNCIRTFIDISTTNIVEHKAGDNFPYKSGPEETKAGRLESTESKEITKKHKVLKVTPGETRLIIASCEKGIVEDINDMRQIQNEIQTIKEQNPNLLEFSSLNIWKGLGNESFTGFNLTKNTDYRSKLIIGIPRVLNLFQYAPFFITYFENLGIKNSNIVFSDFTSDKLYREGSKRGSIDPCFPSKVTLAHIHNLLYNQNSKRHLDIIFFPMVDTIPSDLISTVDHKACPAGLATPQTAKAAFIKEVDIFNEMKINYIHPYINLNESELCEYQLFEAFKDVLKMSKKENIRAIEEGYKALEAYHSMLRIKGKDLIQKLEREDRIGIVILARPYHNDTGLNHGIPEEFQKLGYPILTQDSLPIDNESLSDLFKNDLEQGYIKNALEISDVWKNSFSENTNKKIWAAKFTARHPNLVAIELSNFKCGHDAPIYTVVREIIEKSGTPFFSFRDIDENKPLGSLKIRIETIDYFLKRYQEFRMLQKRSKRMDDSNLIKLEIDLKSALNKIRIESNL
jgi:predicted CoA-substrate-specific enzyme activase